MSSPPYNENAEQAVLGSLLLDPSSFDEVPELRREHFYLERNRAIYDAMRLILDDEMSLDLVTLTDRLRTTGKLNDVGSVPYLSGLADSTPTAAYIASHVRLLQQARLRRDLVELGAYTQAHAVNPSYSPEEVLGTLERRLVALRGGRSEVIDYAAQAAELASETGGAFLQTGLNTFDSLTGGIRGLVIVGGRPSMGKSALLRTVLINCVRDGKKAALFTQDQSGMDAFALEASRHSRVPFHSIKTRRATENQKASWLQSLRDLKDEFHRRLFIDDYPYTLDELAPRIRTAVLREGVKVVGVDYLQLIRVPGTKAEHMVQEVSTVSKTLKHLSQELGVPIIALAQLNRGVESRMDKRPRLDDLRESGQIEQDAEMVVLMYRDEYYVSRSEGRTEAPSSTTELNVAKNKTGPTGTAYVKFVSEYVTFQAHERRS